MPSWFTHRSRCCGPHTPKRPPLQLPQIFHDISNRPPQIASGPVAAITKPQAFTIRSGLTSGRSFWLITNNPLRVAESKHQHMGSIGYLGDCASNAHRPTYTNGCSRFGKPRFMIAKGLNPPVFCCSSKNVKSAKGAAKDRSLTAGAYASKRDRYQARVAEARRRHCGFAKGGLS